MNGEAGIKGPHPIDSGIDRTVRGARVGSSVPLISQSVFPHTLRRHVTEISPGEPNVLIVDAVPAISSQNQRSY